MDDKALTRLQTLRSEFEMGERRLAEIESQRAQLMETMLRIGGAIQVLEELTAEPPAPEIPPANGDGADATVAGAEANGATATAIDGEGDAKHDEAALVA